LVEEAVDPELKAAMKRELRSEDFVLPKMRKKRPTPMRRTARARELDSLFELLEAMACGIVSKLKKARD